MTRYGRWWKTASPDAVFKLKGKWLTVAEYRKLKEMEATHE